MSYSNHTLAFHYGFQIPGKVTVAWIRTIKMNKCGGENTCTSSSGGDCVTDNDNDSLPGPSKHAKIG